MYISLYIIDGRGMNHPRYLRIYAQAVTQIGSQDRQPQTVVFCGNPMGHRHAHLQCITDMLCMTLGGSLTGVSNAQPDFYTRSARQPV